ncbi:hypothetical protein L210DRAFT_2098384 [Boletus edulis BED1]|uniref:Uncharacterized protein n=1 Tax=Boletus edulis BED1 TaxID=1328754 RepID=A0AAD4BF88_BOLED|nr:hypothetical protein L210DRAFT_2098384 [Boletus edulis BED1]
MMILRVYAMWNRSRTILYILLFIYVLQTIIVVILNGIYDNPNAHVSVTMGQVLKFSFCNVSYINAPATLQVYRVASRLSFEMYKATKQWQPNRYMQKLVGDGIIYFFVNVLYQIDYLFALVVAPTNNPALFHTFLYIIFYTLIPRFIISIRELYDHGIYGGFHIDNGFGVVFQSNAGPDTTVSAIVFADGNQSPEAEGGTSNSSDLEMGRVHGSGLNEDSPIGDRE